MRARRTTVATAIAAIVVVVAPLVGGEPRGYQLVVIPQGVSNLVEGERALLKREGTLRLTAFSRRSTAPNGGRVSWCPHEEVFYDRVSESLWDDQGRYVFGPARRDLDRFPVTVDDDHIVRIGTTVQRARGRSKGELAPQVLEFFRRYLDQRASEFARGRLLVWCPRPVG